MWNKIGLFYHYNSASTSNKMYSSILSTIALDGCENWSQLQVETLIEDREYGPEKIISPKKGVRNRLVKSRTIRSFVILTLQQTLLGH